MRNFATESGKSKGQFYTPAEVSRILAKVIGIDKIEERDEDYTVYDPACGSGALLIRAADEAPFEIAIYGGERIGAGAHPQGDIVGQRPPSIQGITGKTTDFQNSRVGR